MKVDIAVISEAIKKLKGMEESETVLSDLQWCGTV
jgi:hypothetical protein